MARVMIVLALNCGSSSLKYAVFDHEAVIARGAVATTDHATAVHAVLDELAERGLARFDAIGHRIVHGGPDHVAPAIVDEPVLAALRRAVPFAPLHLPIELDAIAAARARFGDVPHVVCFDTYFHRTLPELARRFALPVALYDAGIRRYGFHGLSYEYLAASLPASASRRAVFAHLGNGASMVAVRDGASVETTMGLTPTGGLVMGTRSGDLDPGVLVYLATAGRDARALAQLVDHEAGLLALSGTTGDVQQLLAARVADPRAGFAIDAFCYHARKSIGALAAVLGGLDTLVFTGGIGEHAHEIRAEICHGLEHLGACDVRVVATDEERMIARHARQLVG